MVARIALTAGLPGNRIEKILAVRLVVCGAVACLCWLRDWTSGQFYIESIRDQLYRNIGCEPIVPAIAAQSGLRTFRQQVCRV